MTNHPATVADNSADIMRDLRTPPAVSWPAVVLMVMANTAIIVASTLCFLEILPLWAGTVINALSIYLLFTPAHDSMHRSASSNSKLNELIMAASTFVAIPFGTGKFMRVMHMRHHRFTNEENDPDHFLSSHFLLMPVWGFWPFLYLYTFAKSPKDFPGINARETWREVAIGLGTVALLFVIAPVQMLWLWLIPIYVGFFLMCLVFMVLPHYPAIVRESEDPYQATLIRLGWEWLLTPLLAYQNYHLVHHLYPTVPFYRYGKAWKARLAYHQSKNPGVVSPFGLGAKRTPASTKPAP